MNKTTFITVWLLLVAMLNFAQDKHLRIRINNPDQTTLDIIARAGIDLRCGGVHDHNSLTLELSESELNSLKNNNINYQVKIDDLSKFYAERAQRDMPKAQEELKKEKLKSKKQKANTSSNFSRSITSTIVDSYLQYNEEQEVDWTTPTNFNIPTTFGGCLTVSETEAELDAMRAAYPNLISVRTDASPTNQKTYGFTGTNGWAGQTVYYVKISDNPDGADDPNEPDILYTSMIHSRELSSLMGNIYFMWYLLENYATDSAIKHLVDNNELFFVPIVNPDGLRWNEKEDPNGGGMNRTNLRGYPTATNNSNYQENYGVDPNRNFDYLWGSAGDASGSSGTYTSSTYRGPSAFSEPESQIMRDFILARNFKTAVWQHSFANGIPHPYGGIPTKVSGREDEMVRWHQDMTKYNRYIYGANVLSPANGIADDWMLGGTPDANGSVGSGMNILATTPENGANDYSEGGFWPSPTQIVPIAKRMVRINLMNAYYGGKYAKLHDLTQSNLSGTTANLDFGIERIGQTESDFTLTITPISSNITGVTQAGTETGMAVLEQRTVTAQLQLAGGISANEKVEYKVTLNNNDGIIYEANFVKYYNPSILLSDNPDSDNLSNWTSSGDWATTSDSWSGTTAIRFGTSSPYGINKNRTLTTTSSYDLSGSDKTIIQFYSKWDMERNFDFVEFQGSTDGTNWVSLKGVYNKPESSSFTNSARSSYNSTKNSYFSFQSNSSGYIYDGDLMDNWVMEEIIIDNNDNSSLLNAANAQFRFVFRSDGNNSIENYSTTLDGFYFDDFKIISVQIPCETNVPTNLAVSSVGATDATVSWDAIPSATYDLRYKLNGSSTWSEITDIATNSYILNGLLSSSAYDVEVRSRCDTSTSGYSSTVNFTTTDINYCDSNGNDTSDEYIGNVTLNDINNDSEANVNGYSDFTSISTVLTQNTTYNISVTKFWTDQQWPDAVAVWIDYNRDGDFYDAGEDIFSIGASVANPVNGNFTIPSNISFGATRMRVSLKYNALPTPCESFAYGEVEDYTVFLTYDGLMYSNNTWIPNAPSASTGSDNVLVLDGSYSVNSDIEVNDIEVHSNASMIVSKTSSVTVNGDLTANNNVILQSDSDEFSSLIVMGTVTGDIGYERHVNTNANGNDLISAPVSGQVFTDFIANNSNIYSNATNTQFLFGPFDKTASAYVLYTNTESSALTAGTGYRAASTDGGTFLFTGTVNTGPVNVNILNTGSSYIEWNLIGNPYPSFIRLSDFLATNSGQFDIQIEGVYGYDGNATDGWDIRNQAFSDANPNAIIAPGQGFFVASKTGGGTISFTPSMRTVGNSDDFIVGRSSNDNNAISHLKLRMESSSELYYTDFYITDNASLGLDPGYDSGILGGSAPDFAIYSHLVDENQGVDMAVQSISYTDLANNTVIPLGINASQGQQITVSIDETTLDSNVNVYIEDNVESTVTLLNGNDFVFTPSTELSGTGRFYIRFDAESLSDLEHELNALMVYSTSSPKLLHVKGLLTQTSQLNLYDIQGRQILTQTLQPNVNDQQIDVSHLVTGLYVVEIQNSDQSKTKKVIIN